MREELTAEQIELVTEFAIKFARTLLPEEIEELRSTWHPDVLAGLHPKMQAQAEPIIEKLRASLNEGKA